VSRTTKRASTALILAAVTLGLVAVLAQAETPDERALFVQENQAARERAEAEIAAFREAGSKIPSKPDDPVNDRPDPTPTEWGEGIHGEDEFSFPASFGYEFLNVWYHDAGDVYLTVLAGSETETGKAVVQVIRVDPITLKSDLDPPLFPEIQGPVKIVETAGMDLILESVATHERLTLDVATLAFGPVVKG
jgi:hypothetical protein